MSGVFVSAQIDVIEIDMNKKTLLQIQAEGNQPITIKQFSVSFDGTDNTETPIEVELARQSDAGTMSALTVQKLNAHIDSTVRADAYHTATAEPTESAVLMREFVHAQGGYTYQVPCENNLTVDADGRIAIVVTAAGLASGETLNALARIIFEE